MKGVTGRYISKEGTWSDKDKERHVKRATKRSRIRKRIHCTYLCVATVNVTAGNNDDNCTYVCGSNDYCDR